MAYLTYYKQEKLYKPENVLKLNKIGDKQLGNFETKHSKYLNRVFDIVNQKGPKADGMSNDAIFKEIERVILPQL